MVDLQLMYLIDEQGWIDACCALAGASAGHAQGQGTSTYLADRPGAQPCPCCASTCSTCARAHPAQGQVSLQHSVSQAGSRGRGCAAAARQPWAAPCADSAQEQAGSAAGRPALPGAGGIETRGLCQSQSTATPTGVRCTSAHFRRSQARLFGCSLDTIYLFIRLSCHVKTGQPSLAPFLGQVICVPHLHMGASGHPTAPEHLKILQAAN